MLNSPMNIFAAAAILGVGLGTGISLPAQAEPLPMDRLGPIRGIVLDPSGGRGSVLMATRFGVLAGGPDGIALPVSSLNAPTTALTADPRNAKRLFASGQSKKAGNLGVRASVDGGRTWKKIADGMGGPVVFKALAVSPKNSGRLYGAGKDLQVSRDGGATWKRVGPLPARLFSIAVSSINDDTLYAATMKGLLVSRDGGLEWRPAYPGKSPATMVHVTPEGRVYAFVYGSGLIAAEEPGMAWKIVARDFQDRVIMGMAVADDDPERLYAYADTGRVMISPDGGRSWTSLEGSDKATERAIRRGRQLFDDNCAVCHGARGVGERPGDPYAKDAYGFVAPALNDDAHGWHHPDRQLVNMILNGSSRNKRMIAWKEQLSRRDAEQLVAYIKSLWSFRSLACQGSRHMACMR